MRHFTSSGPRRAAMIGLATLLGLATAPPALARDRGADRDDRRTCESFGLRYGSREYARCMHNQQQRRDLAPINAAEAQRANAEAARHNLETVRRMRCEREAKRDRENGVRPRSC